jgi:hypothetical protein
LQQKIFNGGKMAKNDTWFKHYNTAHEGLSILNCLGDKEVELIAYYYIVLELVSKYEAEENRGNLEISLTAFCRILHMNRRKLVKTLPKLQRYFGVCFEYVSDKFVRLSIPNWLKYQERRGGKREAKEEQKNGFAPIDLRPKTQDLRIKTEEEKIESKINRPDPSLEGRPSDGWDGKLPPSDFKDILCKISGEIIL